MAHNTAESCQVNDAFDPRNSDNHRIFHVGMVFKYLSIAEVVIHEAKYVDDY